MEKLELLSGNVAVDCVGALARPTDEIGLDEMGNEQLIWQETPGYHVNVRIREGETLPEDLKPFIIEPPAHPKRVFA